MYTVHFMTKIHRQKAYVLHFDTIFYFINLFINQKPTFMKKFTFFMTMFIAFAMTAFAQVDTGKAYRIKSKSVGNYLTIGESNANTHGHVHGAALDESNQNQVFNFIAVEDQASTFMYSLNQASTSLTRVQVQVGMSMPTAMPPWPMH